MKVFLVAGEPSGDALGGALMAGLKEIAPDVRFDGVGGPLMQAQGLKSRFDMSELSLMGLVEILPKYFHLKRRIAEVATAVMETRPDVLVTIDSPDFCLRVARQVKQSSDVRCVHYVAPTVWAWRPKRAQKMAAMIDQVLALFPFEPPYMQAAGMECDFVGHPVAAEPVVSAGDAAAFRARHGLENACVILALPGSRRGEVSRLAGTFGAALAKVQQAHPTAKVVVPAAASVADLVKEACAAWPIDALVLDGRLDGGGAEKRAAFAAADAALAASGTVSLELAAARTPMVIAYDMAWLTRQIMQRMLLTDTVTLVNLVSEMRVVPEYIGAKCQPGPIAEELLRVLDAPDAQLAAMDLTMERLGRGGEAPGLRAAKAIMMRLGQPS